MQVCLFYVARRKRWNGDMREPRRNGGCPLFLQKKPLHALLGFAIAACTMFAPATVASAAEATTDSQNIQATAEQVGTAGSDDDARQSDGDANGDTSSGEAADSDDSQNNGDGDTSTTETTETDSANQAATDNSQNQANDDSQQQTTVVPQASVRSDDSRNATGDPKLPAAWDDDMARYFPDAVLRKLVDREVKDEFQGKDYSSKTTDQVLRMVSGDNHSYTWNVYNAYVRAKASGLIGQNDRIKLLNGIEKLSRMTKLGFSSFGQGATEGVGLQTLAFPGLTASTRIPDLDLSYNNLHIFPKQLYPVDSGLGASLPTTYNQNITLDQNLFHHTSVTYVRDGSGKQIEFVAGIYKLCDTADDMLVLGRSAANDFNACKVPIFDQRTSDVAKYAINTNNLAIGDDTDTGFTVRTQGEDAREGYMYRQAYFETLAANKDGRGSLDTYSFNYGYEVTMNYLSTVKQQSETKVLGDFKFKKTSEANPHVALKGAVYVVRTTGGEYLTGTQQKDGTYRVATDSKTGKLITTTDRDKALQPETDSKGEFTVRGVPGSKAGVEYRLTEIKAPSGYARSTGEVSVKVRVAKDLKTKVEGGEGTSAIVTKSSIKADASGSAQWQQAQNRVYLEEGLNPNPAHDDMDYAASGDELAQEAADGSAANETKDASDYDGGADLFIKNHGNRVTFSTVASDDDSSLPSDYRLEHQISTLTDGTGKELLNSSDKDALAKVSAHVNGIINKGSMTKTTDYYNVNTVAVYHDTSSADDLNRYIVSDDGSGDQNVQRDEVLPVAVKFNAVKKLLKNGEKEPVKAGEFKFTLEPDEAGAPKLENATAEVGSDGIATWGALDFTADWWSGVKKDDGVADFTYTMKEVDTGSKKYDYDASVYKIRIKVSELEEYSPGETKGLTVRVYVNDELKLRVTSADTQKEGWETPTVKVRSSKDPEATFVNKEKVTDFSFTKKDGETGDTLDGAEFQLYRYNGDCDKTCKATPLDRLNPGNWEKIDTQTSGEHGKVTFKDLTSDTYRLIESKAPSGYTRPSGQWNVVVDLGQTDKANQITITAVEGGNKPPAFKHEQDGGLSVANYRAKTIPSTGGRGLIAFSLMGAMVVLGGGFVLSKRVFGEGALEA